MIVELWVALVAALAPTLTAAAAYIQARRGRQQTQTSNGQSMGELVESTYRLQRNMTQELRYLESKMDQHVRDQRAHASEQTDHYEKSH